ncbi:MAG TPA: DUF3822 family protein [Saprospiraceae bacterium]|nr:DUF3822 family protein [Saprospiraceae bacterium]
MTPLFAFQRPDFSPDYTSSADLRLVVSDSAVSLLVSKGQQVQVVKCWQMPVSEHQFNPNEAELRGILGSERLLSRHFLYKACSVNPSFTTLVPRRLFDERSLPQYFKLLIKPGGKYTYQSAHIPSIDAYLVWALELTQHHLISQYFESSQISHLGATFIEKLAKESPADGYGIFANIHGQRMQCLVFDRTQLVFYNSFEFHKPADLLYYLLLVYKQFELNPANIPPRISGGILEDSEVYRMLMRYFPEIVFLKPDRSFHFPDDAKNLPAHFWFDISIV